MRGMSWCSLSVLRYLFSSSTRCLCVLTPSRARRSCSCKWGVSFCAGAGAGKGLCDMCCTSARVCVGSGVRWGWNGRHALLRLISSYCLSLAVFPSSSRGSNSLSFSSLDATPPPSSISSSCNAFCSALFSCSS